MLSYSYLVKLRAESLDEAEQKIRRLDPVEWSIAGISSFPPIRDPSASHYWRERAMEAEFRMEELQSALDDCQAGWPPIAIA